MRHVFTATCRRWAMSTTAFITLPTSTLKAMRIPIRSNRFGASRRTEYAARIATWEAVIYRAISTLTLSGGTTGATALRCSARLFRVCLLLVRLRRKNQCPKHSGEILFRKWAFTFHQVTLRSVGVDGNSPFINFEKRPSGGADSALLSGGRICAYFAKHHVTFLCPAFRRANISGRR